MKPLLSKGVSDSIRAGYNLIADDYYRMFNGELSEKPIDLRISGEFCDFLTPGNIVCNIGCSPTDDIANFLKIRKLKMTGVDISDRSIEIAKANDPDSEYIREDFLDSTLPDQYFDGIIAYHVLMYIPSKSLKDFFRNCTRILKKNGKIFIAAKERFDYFEGIMENVLGLNVNIFESYHSYKKIERHLASSNFKIEFAGGRSPYPSEMPYDRIHYIASL